MSEVLAVKAAELVAARAATNPMSLEEMQNEIRVVYDTLINVGNVDSPVKVEWGTGEEEEPVTPAMTKRKSLGKTKVGCMICGKYFTTLKRHLSTAHDMTPSEYRKMFDIKAGTPLVAKDYSAAKKQIAIDKGLGDKLVAARAAKKKTTKKK